MSANRNSRAWNPGRRLMLPCILWLSLWLISGAAPAQILGDANGDGTLNLNHVAFMQAAIDGGYAQTDPFALSDVAHPCDGNIDTADLALVERAARGGPRSAPIGTLCHGGFLGQAPPPATGGGDPLTLDEQFLQVAAEVPEFGGVYFDGNGQPVIVLTNDDPNIYTDAVAALIDVFGYERFNTEEFDVVDGEYGFEELHGLRGLARQVLSHPAVVAVDTHEVLNRVWVGITDWNRREEVEAALDEAGVPLEAVELAEVGPFQDHQGFDQFERPVVGGIGGAGCTAGPIVNRSGARGLLTNSHCSSMQGVVDGFQFHQNAVLGSSTLVGTEQFDSPLFTNATLSQCPPGLTCRFSDAIFVNVGMTTGTRRGAIKNSYSPSTFLNRYVHAIELAPMSGDPVRKSGAVTGRTEGEIINTCVDVQSTTSGILNLCTFLMTATSLPGDSGSPVFYSHASGPGHAKLYGMLWGGDSSTSGFVPVSSILSQLGSMDFLSVDEPPILTILNPLANSSLGTGSSFPITLTASVSDFEDGPGCSGCQVTWTSTLDGFLGTVGVSAGVASLNVELFGPGTRTLTATAQDSIGHQVVDQITVYTGNAAPTVWIIEPSDNAQIPLGVGVTFTGSSSDPELLGGPLGCGSLAWTSNVSGDPAAIGCTAVLTFNSLGQRDITLFGIDAYGKSDTDTITVNVVPLASTGLPIITMVEPEFNPLLAREQVHSLTGYATDPDGKSPIQYEWVLKGPGLIGATNGEVTIGVTSGANGATTTLNWLPSNYVIEACGGIVLDLELRATDADNEQAALPRQITVSGPLC